tara:strand:- start:737 stop:4729 length:3993 start_codon:yes stop_codon:yes gene_type:complete
MPPKKAPSSKQKKKDAKKDAIKKATSGYQSKFKRNLVSKALGQSLKTDNTKNYVAYNPQTDTFISGNISQIAKELKTTPATIKSRFDKQLFKPIKDFQIYRFKDDVDSVNFRKEIVKKDEDKPIKKKTPIKKKVSYEVISDRTSDNKASKFGNKKNHFEFKFKDGVDFSDLDIMIADIVDRTIKKEKLTENDYIRIVIVDDNLDASKGGFISTPIRKVKDFSPKVLFDLLESVQTSDETYEITNGTQFIVESVQMYTGSGHKDNFDGDINDYAHFKKSVITITNDDTICMARAIIVGISLIQDKPKAIAPNKKENRESNSYYKRWENIRKGDKKGGPLQRNLAKKLHQDAMVEIKPEGNNINDLDKFAYFVKAEYGYQLNMMDLNCKRVIYPDVNDEEYEPVDKDKNIYLLYNNNTKHYDLINNNLLAGFMEKSNFCHLCKKYYRRENQHNCKFKCNVCCFADCDSINYFQSCRVKKERPKFAFECLECCRFFATECCYNNHLKTTYKKNGEMILPICKRIWKCPDCGKTIADDSEDRKKNHICGEFICKNCHQKVQEGHQCYMMPKPLKEHSDKYIFFDFESDISGPSHYVMYSVSAYFDDEPEDYVIHHSIEGFCKWAFSDNHKDYTFIAHNGKGYDFQFVMKWILENISMAEPPTIIKAGTKIMYFSIPKFNIAFIDSLNHLTNALADIPPMFGFEEMKKGYFPHWFNTKENWLYEGPVPPYEYFKPHNMKDEKKIEFDKWWCFKKLSNYKWVQRDEMRGYCISDVNILQRGMLKYRELFLQVAGIDPLRYITIASVCMSIYRYYYVDFSFPERYKIFYEDIKYEKDAKIKKEKKEKFQSETNEIIFDEKKFGCYSYDLIKKIRPAFFGGRTNAVKLLYNFQEGEVGKYADVTSLYPTVQFYDEYPLGHPIIYDSKYINQNYQKVLKNLLHKKYFGFIHCKLNPPKDLYHPVLAHKGEKLVFDLRCKEGTWASNEFYKAIDKGYEILHIIEIIHYEETTRDLFKPYVQKFLKIKEEASGYPDHITKHKGKVSDKVYDDMCNKHIQNYYEVMGIMLDKNNIKKNKGLRAVAKLCLNSLWGKFGQRTNLTQSIICKDKQEFFKIIENKQNDNVNFFQYNEDVMEITYDIKEEYIPNDFTTNIGVAAFTTASARLRLYEGLEHLNHQVLYFDTDSIVYVYNPNDPNKNKSLKLGDFLGQWTDECDGLNMVGCFASGGPKNYTYKLDDVEYKYCIKVKGLNLHHKAKKSVNHHKVIKSIRDKYENYENTLIPIEYDMLKRDKFCNIVNQMLVKNYQVVYTKRKLQKPIYIEKDGKKLLHLIDTRPFGFEQN